MAAAVPVQTIDLLAEQPTPPQSAAVVVGTIAPRRLTLYEITGAIAAILEASAEAEGEITPEQEVELDRLTGSRDAKMEGLGLYRRELLATGAALETEIRNLQARRERIGKDVDRLDRFAETSLRLGGLTSAGGARAKVALQKNGGNPRVEWVGQKNEKGEPVGLPAAFVKVTPEKIIPASRTLDLVVVHACRKAGEALPEGVVVHPQGERLVWK
jgi:hypothetical protein